jgi:hypothetical protein
MWLGTRAQLQLEILALRHQVTVLRRQRNVRPRLTSCDRAFWIWLYRLWPSCLDALDIVRPETVVRRHREGFRRYWRWKSRARSPGRPAISPDIRNLIARMSQEYPLWGAPRIHGELLKLGIEVSQASVSKYMTRPPRPPSQTWRASLRKRSGRLSEWLHTRGPIEFPAYSLIRAEISLFLRKNSLFHRVGKSLEKSNQFSSLQGVARAETGLIRENSLYFP